MTISLRPPTDDYTNVEGLREVTLFRQGVLDVPLCPSLKDLTPLHEGRQGRETPVHTYPVYVGGCLP